jgi:tetratricopeptide (TPR) repeat protein
MKHGVSLVMCCVLFLFAGPLRTAASPTNQLVLGVDTFSRAFDDWSFEGFVAASDLFAAVAQATPILFPAFYWQGVADFHAVLWCAKPERGEARTKAAQRLQRLERACNAFEAGLKLKPDDPECHALLSALLGVQIADHPATAIWRGPLVMRHQRLALLHGPDNPRVHYLIGSGFYHAPSFLGDRKQALVHFLKAEALFEKEADAVRDPLQPRWGRSSCLTFTGRLYQETGDHDKAVVYFQKALEANPLDKLAIQYLLEWAK